MICDSNNDHIIQLISFTQYKMKLATKTIKIIKVLTEVTREGSRGLISHRCLYNRKSLCSQKSRPLLTMNPPKKDSSRHFSNPEAISLFYTVYASD